MSDSELSASTDELGDAAEKRRLRNLRRRVANARDFPENTCPASRHLHLMASALATGKQYPMLADEGAHALYAHEPFPSWGRIVRDGDGFRWERS